MSVHGAPPVAAMREDGAMTPDQARRWADGFTQSPGRLKAAGFPEDFWMHQQRRVRDVLRCLRGRHRAAMEGALSSGSYAERCTCGALRLDGGRWSGAEPFRLVSAKESAELIRSDGLLWPH